jgi:hypothetical protein
MVNIICFVPLHPIRRQRYEIHTGSKTMQNVLQHKKIHMLAATGRGVLVLIVVITAITNIVTALVEFPWNVAGLTEPLFDLGEHSWESYPSSTLLTRTLSFAGPILSYT